MIVLFMEGTLRISAIVRSIVWKMYFDNYNTQVLTSMHTLCGLPQQFSNPARNRSVIGSRETPSRVSPLFSSAVTSERERERERAAKSIDRLLILYSSGRILSKRRIHVTGYVWTIEEASRRASSHRAPLYSLYISRRFRCISRVPFTGL